MTDAITSALGQLNAVLSKGDTKVVLTDMNNLVTGIMKADLTSATPPSGSGSTVTAWQAYIKDQLITPNQTAWNNTKIVPKSYAKRFITNFANNWQDLSTASPKWSTMTQALDYMQAKGGFDADAVTSDPVHAAASGSKWCTTATALNSAAQANLDLFGDFARGVDFCKTANPSSKPNALELPTDIKSQCAIARGMLTNHSNDGRQVANFIRQDTCGTNYFATDVWSPPKIDSTHYGTISTGLMAKNSEIKGQFNKTGKWSRISGGNATKPGVCDTDIIDGGDCSAMHDMYTKVADGAASAYQAQTILYVAIPLGALVMLLLIWGLYKLFCRT